MKLFAKLLDFSRNKYAKNTGWLFAEKVVRVAVNFVVTIYLVKYLGPDNFGLLSYALSYVALFSSIASLGMDNLIVRDLVSDTANKDKIIGTSLFLKVLASAAAVLLLFLNLHITHEDPFTIQIVMMVSFSLIFQTLNVYDFYFQSQLLSKFAVISQSSSLIIASLLRVLLIVTKAKLIYFAAAVTFEAAILAVGLVAFYRSNNRGKLRMVFDSIVAKRILKETFPLLLSVIVVSIYMKIDQIMVKNILNNTQAGFYAAAVKLCEIWYFIPAAISASLFPAVINARKGGEELFNKRLQQLYDLMVWISVGIAIPLTLFAPQIMSLLFGTKFLPGAPVLQIYIWSGVGTFLGVASSQFLVAENFTKISFYRTLAGMLTNLALNFYLIPKIGIVGAAYATLISYTIATFFVLFFKDSAHQGKLMLRSLFFISLKDYRSLLAKGTK